MNVWRVQIFIYGQAAIFERVYAKTAKDALKCVIESIPEQSPVWQAPGWQQVQILPEGAAFILQGGAS